MEEKESLLKTIEEVNDDETVMQEWILEENARLKYEGQMSYAREEGIQEEKLATIKNMLNKAAFKSLSMVAAAALVITETNVNTCCWYYFGQDELPKEARKLRKF